MAPSGSEQPFAAASTNVRYQPELVVALIATTAGSFPRSRRVSSAWRMAALPSFLFRHGTLPSPSLHRGQPTPCFLHKRTLNFGTYSKPVLTGVLEPAQNVLTASFVPRSAANLLGKARIGYAYDNAGWQEAY